MLVINNQNNHATSIIPISNGTIITIYSECFFYIFLHHLQPFPGRSPQGELMDSDLVADRIEIGARGGMKKLGK